MISAKRLSSLLAALHSAPLEDAQWQVFFDGLCQEIEAVHGLFIAAGSKQGSAQILAQGGSHFNPDGQRLYNEHYAELDPYWAAFVKRPRTGPIIADELVPRREAERSEFFNELAAPTGLHHALAVPAVLLPTGAEAITVWRSAGQRPFEEEDVDFFQMLMPHLQAALNTRRALSTARLSAYRIEAALDMMPVPCFILSASGKLVHCNESANELLALNDGISVKHGKLNAFDSETNKRLGTMVRSAASASAAILADPGGALSIPRRSSRPDLKALILPLRLPVMLAPVHVLVLITDPQATVELKEHMLRSLFGLTPAEIQVVNALSAGLTVEEIADSRQASPGTIRIQLKSIFQKTGVRRQSDLIRQLQILPRTHFRTRTS